MTSIIAASGSRVCLIYFDYRKPDTTTTSAHVYVLSLS